MYILKKTTFFYLSPQLVVTGTAERPNQSETDMYGAHGQGHHK